jgi:transcriptional regulator with XRE-family HTH domain
MTPEEMALGLRVLQEAGEMARAKRQMLGLTQAEAADVIGIAQATLSRAENGVPMNAGVFRLILNWIGEER